MSENKENGHEKAPTFLQIVGSTMLSFLGVSKDSRRKRDFQHGDPKVFIMSGFLLAFMFVMAVVGLVQLVLPD